MKHPYASLILLPSLLFVGCTSTSIQDDTESGAASLEVASCRTLALRSVPEGTVCRTSVGGTFRLVKREAGLETWQDDASALVWNDFGPSAEMVNQQDAQEKCSALGTPERVFWLPEAHEFEAAERSGFREVLPNVEGRKLWSSTYLDRETAVRFRADDAKLTQVHWHHVFSGQARCVGAALPFCKAEDLRSVAVGTRCRAENVVFELVARDANGKEVWRDFMKGDYVSDVLDRAFAATELAAARDACAPVTIPAGGVRFEFPTQPLTDLPTMAAFDRIVPNVVGHRYLVGNDTQLYAVDFANEQGQLTELVPPLSPAATYSVRCLGFAQIPGLDDDF
jgi:hypothetical protein